MTVVAALPIESFRLLLFIVTAFSKFSVFRGADPVKCVIGLEFSCNRAPRRGIETARPDEHDIVIVDHPIQYSL